MAGSTMASNRTAVCNKYANEVINKDISIKLIKCQRRPVYGYKTFGGDHCGCASAATHCANSWYAAPLWSWDIQAY